MLTHQIFLKYIKNELSQKLKTNLFYYFLIMHTLRQNSARGSLARGHAHFLTNGC